MRRRGRRRSAGGSGFDFTTSGLVALGVALLLASLSLVTWRQSRALEALAELDRLQRERSLAEAEVVELTRRIDYLESRGRVVPEAGARLDMHVPSDEAVVYMRGGDR